jgi:hypothetical protein
MAGRVKGACLLKPSESDNAKAIDSRRSTMVKAVSFLMRFSFLADVLES